MVSNPADIRRPPPDRPCPHVAVDSVGPCAGAPMRAEFARRGPRVDHPKSLLAPASLERAVTRVPATYCETGVARGGVAGAAPLGAVRASFVAHLARAHVDAGEREPPLAAGHGTPVVGDIVAGRQIALTGRMVVVSGRGEIAAGDADMDRDVSVRTGHGNLRGVGPCPRSSARTSRGYGFRRCPENSSILRMRPVCHARPTGLGAACHMD